MSPRSPRDRRLTLARRFGLALQLPVLLSMGGLVLVSETAAERFDGDLRAHAQLQYAQVASRLPREVPARAADEGRSQPSLEGASEPARPLSMWGPPLLLFVALVVLSGVLGRWLGAEVAGELNRVRRALVALRQSPTSSPEPAGAMALRETQGLVKAFQTALLGLNFRRDALEQATERHRAADQEKARFLAHLSHELKSPLNTILGFTEVLLTGLDGPLPEVQRRRLGILWRSGESLLRFILCVLDLAKLEMDERHEKDPPGQMQSADELVAAIAQAVRPDPLGQVTVEVQGLLTPEARGLVTHDAQQLARAIAALAGLLVDALERGSVLLHVTSTSGALEVVARVENPGDESNLADLESGRRRLWSELSSQQTSERATSSTSTALALIRRVARAHGGALEVEGEPNPSWPSLRLSLPFAEPCVIAPSR